MTAPVVRLTPSMQKFHEWLDDFAVKFLEMTGESLTAVTLTRAGWARVGKPTLVYTSAGLVRIVHEKEPDGEKALARHFLKIAYGSMDGAGYPCIDQFEAVARAAIELGADPEKIP